jgi:hypothetical protein
LPRHDHRLVEGRIPDKTAAGSGVGRTNKSFRNYIVAGAVTALTSGKSPATPETPPAPQSRRKPAGAQNELIRIPVAAGMKKKNNIRLGVEAVSAVWLRKAVPARVGDSRIFIG